MPAVGAVMLGFFILFYRHLYHGSCIVSAIVATVRDCGLAWWPFYMIFTMCILFTFSTYQTGPLPVFKTLSVLFWGLLHLCELRKNFFCI